MANTVATKGKSEIFFPLKESDHLILHWVFSCIDALYLQTEEMYPLPDAFQVLRLWSRVLSGSSHLCSHEGQGVHAIRSSQQSTDHSQAATGQQQGHQQANHSNMAVHGGGRRERELQKEKIYHVVIFDFLPCFLKM